MATGEQDNAISWRVTFYLSNCELDLSCWTFSCQCNYNDARWSDNFSREVVPTTTENLVAKKLQEMGTWIVKFVLFFGI